MGVWSKVRVVFAFDAAVGHEHHHRSPSLFERYVGPDFLDRGMKRLQQDDAWVQRLPLLEDTVDQVNEFVGDVEHGRS